MSVTTLPFYGDAMATVLREEDEAKLQLLTSAMASSKTSGKLTSTLWQRV